MFVVVRMVFLVSKETYLRGDEGVVVIVGSMGVLVVKLITEVRPIELTLPITDFLLGLTAN